MNKIRHILVMLALVIGGSVLARADEPEQPQRPNIVEEIVEQSQGNITIEIPDEVKNNLDYFYAPEKKQDRRNKRINDGYRIQVFNDGTDQRTLKARATSRGSAIVARFPKYSGQVYTSSNPPKWSCYVGNFQTLEEANKALAELRAAFPQFAGEFRTVPSTIILR